MSIIVCNCQHCNEQQFQTLSCVHYTIFSVVKLDLFMRVLLLDRILALEKNYAYASRTSCLGLILYDSLSWDKHINHIFLKVSKAIGILYRLKSIYPHRVLLTLYNTLILPHYCILSWG